MKKQDDDNYRFIDKTFLYVQDRNEAKYQNLIYKR